MLSSRISEKREDTMSKIYTGTTVRRRFRKTATILIAAAIAAFLLTGAAFATGIAQSIFSAMKGRYESEDPAKYETIEELSNKDEVAVTIPEMDDTLITLSQSYYDGERLMLGYTLNASLLPADFDFGPEHENFSKLQPVETETTALALPLEEMLSADEYARFERTLEETDSVGVIFYEIFVGDHVVLEDGADIGPHGSVPLPNGVYMEFATPLSEAAQNQDELHIFFKVKCSPWYYYQDAEVAYYYYDVDATKTELIGFDIPRSTG
jgi:hypothetical protein